MRRLLTILAATTALLAISHHTLNAQSATAALTVTASVTKNCTITTSPVNFGAYDPVVTNVTTPLDGIGTITVTCTKGATARIGLNAGANSPGGTARRMSQTASAYLNYELYKDAARVDVWGDTVSDSLDLGAAVDRNPRTVTAYGRVAVGQDATVGSYTDTVVATVNF